MALVMDETAYRLLWLAQWKLQQESEHMEPMLTKMIGHLSVYQKAAEYMEEHDVAEAIFGTEPQSEAVDEFSELLAHESSKSPYQTEQTASTSSSTPPPNSSVVVSAVEVDADAAEGDRNPFSDDEEVSSVGDDDINWSSDDETEFGSVSSFEEEGDAAGDHGQALLKEGGKMGDIDMDPIWRRPKTMRDADLLPPDVDGWARSFPPLVRPATPLRASMDRVAFVAGAV
ncbi:hypothetical protein AYL99_05685 [Fonsecaea erecta]|uniref:Uncharacterized protein n=1 Tax=Fonsecaea erecta TaxID=1367422 RepID=A0A178ZNA8_9EURO|nr:hypothetical protein AYL99_05685 [Fonsecaea erecta]OAP60683.1 hypothetical protein AYL99_05685 [Fonsecaea erecta]